jgi:hypothetical protein
MNKRKAAFVTLAAAYALACAACGAPGEPTPPTPPVAAAVSDLSARQRGDSAQLRFTLPAKTISGEKLAEPPAVEVLRGLVRPDGSPDVKSLRVVETIPGALLLGHLEEERVELFDPLRAEEIRNHPGAGAAYAVRTRASKKRASANSNVVILKLYPVPQPIPLLQVNVTETAVELKWEAPSKTSAGDALQSAPSYNVYRGELDPASAEGAAKDLAQAKWRVRPVLLAPTEATTYRDSAFEFGKTYVYVVHSVVSPSGELVESADSSPAILTPKDTFPPAVPSGLVAAVLAGPSGAPQVDLSWSINAETDLAGYRVYRSEQGGTRGALVAPELLPTPAVRDTSVLPGHRYWYSVTAVDAAGNESAASPQILVEVTELSP